MANQFDGDVVISNGLLYTSDFPRSQLALESLTEYPIPWEKWRVWDAYSTLLPTTGASDDLGLYAGTFATSSPAIKTGDVKTLTATRYARCTFELPPEYVAGQPVRLRIKAGMLVTVADTSCTIDAQIYESDDAAGIGSDLVTTAAQSMNSLTAADKDFVLTASGLAPGDRLDIRIAVAVVDGATATEVNAQLGNIAMLLGIRG